jgi:hypothetical protein
MMLNRFDNFSPVPGTLDPLRGIADRADPQQELLCAIALGRYSKASYLARPIKERAEEQSILLLRYVSAPYEQNGVKGGDASVILLIAHWFGQGVPLSKPPLEPLWAAPLATGCFQFAREQAKGDISSLSVALRGMVAYARALDDVGASVYRDAAASSEFARVMLDGTPPGELVAAMPWIGWADQRNHPQGALQSAVRFREERGLIWKHQLQPNDLPADQQDLAGGIVFDTSRNPMSSWQMARPLAFVATMLGDPRLTKDEEIPGELSRLLLSLRFLRQLTAGEAESFMYRDREKAIGAVRSSLWDQRMPPEATAMTLMAVCETQRSLEEIQARRDQKK